MAKQKTRQQQVRDLELANETYAYIENKLSLKEYTRRKKVERIIHKRQSWRAYTV